MSYSTDSPACALIGKRYEKNPCERALCNGVNRAGTSSVQDKQNGKKQEDRKKEREGHTRDKMPTDWDMGCVIGKYFALCHDV